MKFRKVYSFIVGVGLLFVVATPIKSASVSLSDLWQPASMLECVSFEITGICVDWDPPRIGVEITMWRPELIVETVKKPGDTVMPFIGDILSEMCSTALKAVTGAVVTSGSTTTPGDSNLQFNEVHVYDYPFKNLLATYFLGFWCYDTAESIGSAGFFKYLTELDFEEWRTGVMESITHALYIALNTLCAVPIPGTESICMGYWGPIYPRTGFLSHHSEVVGSAGGVFRAVSNASLYGLNFHHIRTNPLWWTPSTGDKIQMLYPMVSGCMDIGENPILWEEGKTSITGEYLWLYWRQVTCCIW